MKIATSQIIRKYKEIINSYDLDESVIYSLIEYLTGKYRSDLLLTESIKIDEVLLNEMVMEYCNGKSLQYITNTSYFLNRKFYVDNNVLIPRFETEEVVLKAIEIINENNIKSVCDIGCGSGVIGITISLECGIEVECVDISAEAIAVTKRNCEVLHANLKLINANLLDEVSSDIEMIVSNPPYIPNEGYVSNETLKNEPHLALFGGNDGMDFYRKIINDSKRFKKLKFIVFEIGYNQAKLFEELVENINIYKDINGNDRIAVIDLRGQYV